MSDNYAQSMLFGLVCSDFIFEDKSITDNKAELLLSNSMIGLLDNIESKAEDTSNYFKNADSLLDFVILSHLYQQDIDSLKNLIVASSEHPDSIASQLGIVALSKCIFDNQADETYFPVIWESSSGISDDYDMTIRKIGHVLGWGSENHAMKHLGTGKKYEEMTTIALYCILKHPNNYISAVKCAQNTPQNGEIIARLVAILMGLKLGIGVLPPIWIEYCKNLNIIYRFNF